MKCNIELLNDPPLQDERQDRVCLLLACVYLHKSRMREEIKIPILRHLQQRESSELHSLLMLG